jgi:Domain of unknown function (DUF3527)
MHLETHKGSWHDDHTPTNSSEGSEGLQKGEKKQIQTQNLHKIDSLDQRSNLENISCKIPIIFEKDFIQPYKFNPDVTFLEVIIKGLKNQRTHRVNDLDELLRNDPSKYLVYDWMEASLKVRMQPKIQSKLGAGNMVTVSNKRQDTQISAYSNTNSYMSSYQSSSSTNSTSYCTSTDATVLHRVWHNELPHFQFSIGPDRVFIANPRKVKSQNNLAMDYVYLFHEVENAKESTSRFLGNMRVSSSYVLNPNGTTGIETEFVLFGSKEDYDQEMQNTSSSLVKNKGLIRKVAEMIKPSFSPLPRYTHKTSKSLLCNTSLVESEISGNKQLGSTSSIICGDLPTNQELATIIVRDSKNCISEQGAMIDGGWGLKFLQKIETRKHNSSRQKINVLVPKGFHGGPLGPSVGPANLRERWSSGTCDCGGWDSGCPITAFSNRNGSDGLLDGEFHGSDTEDLFIEVSLKHFFLVTVVYLCSFCN